MPTHDHEVKLVLERRDQANESGVAVGGWRGEAVVMFTPPISEDYWAYRVVVGDDQAIVGFPKYTTIGIGFAKEEDWNTNLPYTCGTEEIWHHIDHNKGDDAIPDERCIEAIRMVQEAVNADRHPGQRAGS